MEVILIKDFQGFSRGAGLTQWIFETPLKDTHEVYKGCDQAIV